MATFADRVRELRKEKKMKQQEMAEFLGISSRGYQCYEYGEGYPEVPGLLKLAEFFDVSLDYLMCRTDKKEINR